MRSNAKLQARYPEILFVHYLVLSNVMGLWKKVRFRTLLGVTTSGLQSHVPLTASQAVGRSIPAGQAITPTH